MKMQSVQCGLIHECCAVSVVLCYEFSNSEKEQLFMCFGFCCILQTVVRVTFLMPRSKVKPLCMPW
jgi:hypothetical protein